MNKKYILIDLYTGKSELIPSDEVKEATYGLKKKKGVLNVWKGEEYMVVEVSQWAKLSHSEPSQLTSMETL